MSITTKYGDYGSTMILGGVVVSKDSLIIDALGSIDELTSTLGYVRAISKSEEVAILVYEIQEQLFRYGSAIANQDDCHFSPEYLEFLDVVVNEYNDKYGIPENWIVPGDNQISAYLDVSRSVCRRVERCINRLDSKQSGTDVLQYINRLSDVLWLVARSVEIENKC